MFPRDVDWGKYGIESDAHRLFLLLWMEFLDEHTADTWQVRTSNVRTLLAELAETAQVAHHYDPYRHHIPHLIEEARVLAGLDPIVKRHFPFAQRYLTAIKADASNLHRLQSLAHLLVSYLHSYPDFLIADLRASLEHPDPHKKSDLYALTLTLATHLAAMGYSTTHLRCAWDIFAASPNTPFVSRFDEFVASCQGTPHKYEAVCCVTWPSPLEQTPALFPGITIARGAPSDPQPGIEADFYGTFPSDALFVRQTLHALDPLSARIRAESGLARAFDTLKLYQIQRTPNVRGDDFLLRSDDGSTILVPSDSSRLAYIRNSHNPERRIHRLLELLERLQDSDSEPLLAALQYHRLALSAPTDEGRLINMWTALECLVRRPGRYGIEAICASIPDTIASNRLIRLLRSLSYYIRRCAPRSDTHTLYQTFDRSDPRQFHWRDLLDALLDQQDGHKINALYSAIDDNLLVRYRIHRLRNGQLANASAFGTSLRHHRRNIDWQIRRIYRARNDIIHRGNLPSNTRHLVQHLHTYLVLAIHNLVHDLREHSTWSISHALEQKSALVTNCIQQLTSKPTPPVDKATLLDLSHWLEPQGNDLAWPAAPHS